MATAAVDRFPLLISHAAHATSKILSDLTTDFKTQTQLNDDSLDDGDSLDNGGSFDPKKHVAFTPPSNVLSMSDIKLKDSPLSSFAVSEPFQLFSPEAVERMREEIFKPQVKKYQFSSNLAAAQLRGYAKKEAPFTYQAWTSPEVLAIISKIAGLDLVVCMDYEIGHINLSGPASASTQHAQAPQNSATGSPAGIQEEANPIVDWHTDSYPFVVVTMLSDCTDMVGGETMLRKGDGTTLKVRGPQMGYSVILQGRYIVHKALRAYGSAERITSVTSFRPRDHALPDETVLTTVRPVSDLDQLYAQYTEYRFENLQKRLEDQIKAMRASSAFDVKAMKAFLKESAKFLVQMDKQIIEKGLVNVGNIDKRQFSGEKPDLVDREG